MTNTRIEQIDAILKVIQSGWPFLLAEVQARIADETERLITQNNEETRGRIKALRDLLTLPETLESERAGILAAELSEQDSAL